MSETGRFFASSEERDRTTRARTLRSCVTCRNRKVRCDKARPCGACRRSGSECVFLTEARRPLQPRLPNAVLLERIERLESVIEMISSKGSSEASSTPAPERIGSHDSTTEMDRHSTGNNNLPDNYGRLVSSVDGSRYMGPNYWALLKPELDNVKEALEEAIEPAEDMASYGHSFSFFARSMQQNLSGYYPTPHEQDHIYRRYVESVDPLIRIIHKPTFERQLHIFRDTPNHPSLGLNFEPLFFGMCLVSVTSMHPDFVRLNYQTSKDDMLQKYRIALEQALANSRYLHCKDIPTLQGMIFCVLALRHTDLIRSSLSLLSMVITAAKGMGLHRDGSHFNLRPIERELRRRIWYTIAILDINTHEELGLEPIITDDSYDTRVPLNIDDVDLTDEWEPVERNTFTEMTHLLSFIGPLRSLRKVAVLSSQKFDTTSRPGEKLERIFEELDRSIRYSSEKWFRNINESVPIQWNTKMLFNMLTAKAKIVLYHPFLHLDGQGQQSLVSPERRELLFNVGVEALEANAAMTSSSMSDPYNWYFQYFHIAHVGALVINDLAHLPACPLVDRAWMAIDFLVANKDPYRTGKPNWSRYIRAFQKLFERAFINRDRTGAGGFRSQNRSLESNLIALRELFGSDPATGQTPPGASFSTSSSSPSATSSTLSAPSETEVSMAPFLEQRFENTQTGAYENYNWVSFTDTKSQYLLDTRDFVS